MSDIVERLRHCPTDWHPAVVAEQAADEIARLRAEVKRLTGERDRQYDYNAEQIARYAALEAEVERLRAALREIAKVTRGWEPGVWSEEEGRKYFAALFFSAQHVARAALEEK